MTSRYHGGRSPGEVSTLARKVLFIDPGLKFIFNKRGLHADRYFPRGVLSVASFLRSRGVPAEVFPVDGSVDERLNLEENPQENFRRVSRELAAAIQEHDPVYVGVGCIFTMQYPLTLRLLEMVKALRPSLPTVIGGYHATFRDRATFEDSPAVDVVVRGEGEWTALDLYYAFQEGRDLAEVPGITFRANGSARRNGMRPPGDLAEVPPIDYGLVPSDYLKDTGINLVVSRGCAFRCSYCVEPQFFERKVRRFPFPTVMEEIRRLNRRWPGIQFNLEDSMFYVRSRHFLDFCEHLRRLRIPDVRVGYINSRVDTVSEEGLRAAREAGISGIIYGVETASPKVMELMKKHITMDRAVKACQLSQKLRINTGTYWLFGHPGDSPEEAEITLQAIERFYREGLHQGATFSMFLPYPGTPFFEQPERWGMRILTYDWEKWGRFNEERVCELEGFSAEEIYQAFLRAVAIRRRYQLLPALYAWAREHSEPIPGPGGGELVAGEVRLQGVSVDARSLVEILGQLDEQFGPRWVGVAYSGNQVGVRLSPSLARERLDLEELAALLGERLGGRYRARHGMILGSGFEACGRSEKSLRATLREILEPLFAS